MTHEEKTISILKQAGQVKPDFGRFANFISQMNVTMDTGRNLQVEYGRIPSFWALGRLLAGAALIILIAVTMSSNPSSKTSYVIDKAMLNEQDAALYEELSISSSDSELVAYLNSPELNEFDQTLNYEIENI